jgi:hypothetical protein
MEKKGRDGKSSIPIHSAVAERSITNSERLRDWNYYKSALVRVS